MDTRPEDQLNRDKCITIQLCFGRREMKIIVELQT